ncbi:hypothetical protein HCA99_16845 [Listeria booriae]|uniref:hypothetical protein n=1 Tax=Listeria booriae TaxID=1552123 RepID=UPI0016291F79|nr:hypothetical protein [Listeria booriae]MBC2080901.1 hypothetical protein [Listeria booriae]
MSYTGTIDKSTVSLYDSIHNAIKFCRQNGSVVEYGYQVYSFEDSDKPFIVITHDDEFMPVTAWNEFDLALFRFYLDDKHKDLPIYMDFGSDDIAYFFAWE